MRILVLTNLYPNPFQPQRATFNRQQVKELANAGHEMAVISPIAWTDELSARRAGSPALPRTRRLEWDGVPVEYPRFYFTPRGLRGWYGQFYRWSVRGAFRRAARALRPEVVFATWAYPDGWAAVSLTRRAGLPVVLKVHGSDLLQLGPFPSRRRGTAEALRGADRVIAVSQDLACKSIELGTDPGRVRVIYNGVDPSVFSPGSRAEAHRRLGLSPERPALLFIGNLLPVKGLDVLIEACAILKASGLDFDLHLIGRGPLRGQIERDVEAKDLRGRVTLHGTIAHECLPDWYRAASLFVLPSRSEGVPNVLLEASACGTPFVASDVGGIPEIAHLGAGRLVRAGDAKALAGVIREELCGSGAKGQPTAGRRTHAEAARELAKVFWEAIEEYRPTAGRRYRQVEALAAC